MTLPLGFRPRSESSRLRLARVLREAPPRVALAFDDDGWTAASLAIGGVTPVWAGPGDGAACAAVLARLGLPPLGAGPAEATLRQDLTWAPGSALVAPAAGVALAAPPPRVDAATPERPLVTILVCTFNRAALIGEAIASARAQSWPCEILVVDDGSTDGTAEVLAGLDGVRVVRQAVNGGKPAALARGVSEARGDAILVLDDDDLLLPRAVEVLARALFADPARVAVWADTVVFDGATGAPEKVLPATRMPRATTERVVLQQIPAMPGATLVRTASWRAVGPGDPTLIRGQDMDLYLSLARLGPIETVPLSTFFYRSHDGLRGAAGEQWRKRDPTEHRRRFLRYVQPVFARRWADHAPTADRATGFAWALGLFQRDLVVEARRELARWPGPYSEAEAWVRTHVGLPTRGQRAPGVLVVVDDGDEGALEETLWRRAAGESLFVDLEVPRDPLDSVRLYWPGTYGARERPSSWVGAALRGTPPAPWRLALTSAPGWAPPPLPDPRWLPDTPGPEAVLAAAAALGWEAPVRERAGLPAPASPLVALAREARAALSQARPDLAMRPLSTLVGRAPGWAAAWWLTAEAFDALGLSAEAAGCRSRVSAAPARAAG
jgi:GT2 family glycosyltransferase